MLNHRLSIGSALALLCAMARASDAKPSLRLPLDVEKTVGTVKIVNDMEDSSEYLVLGKIDTVENENHLETGIKSNTLSVSSSSRILLESAAPSSVTTDFPSDVPSATPSALPSTLPSESPSIVPSSAPSTKPSESPSIMPSATPSIKPSAMRSSKQTDAPSTKPSESPSNMPSAAPSTKPSESPSIMPSAAPSAKPSARPSSLPSEAPSVTPKVIPVPIASPAKKPSSRPVTEVLTCPTGQYKLSIELTTDDFGSETTWEVVDALNKNMIMHAGGPYPDRFERYKYGYCMNANSCYKFVIHDSSRDGLKGDASGWKVTWNNVVKGHPRTSDRFSADGVDFGDSCVPMEFTNFKDAGNNGRNLSYGVMFDVRAQQDIVMRRFTKLHTFSKKFYNYKVFTKNGSHKGYENDASAWTLIQEDPKLKGEGYKNYTSTKDVDFDQLVPILSNTTQSFYVVLDQPEQVYFKSNFKPEGLVFRVCPAFSLMVGTYNEPKFGKFQEGAGWNGRIRYSRLESNRKKLPKGKGGTGSGTVIGDKQGGKP